MVNALVAGRECGDCNVCCSYYEITDPLLSKPHNTLCPNWRGGCTIYDARPKTCSDYYCLWRRTASLDDGWRPDRLGVVIHEKNTEIPEYFAQRVGLAFDICGAPEVIGDRRLVLAIADQIHQGVPVFLRVAGAAGFSTACVLLNEMLVDAVVRRDVPVLQAKLREIFAAMQTRARMPVSGAATA